MFLRRYSPVVIFAQTLAWVVYSVPYAQCAENGQLLEQRHVAKTIRRDVSCTKETIDGCPKTWRDKMTSFLIRFDSNLDDFLTGYEFMYRDVSRCGSVSRRGLHNVLGLIWNNLLAKDNRWDPEPQPLDDVIGALVPVLKNGTQLDFLRKWLGEFFYASLATNVATMDLDRYTAFLTCMGVHPRSVPASFEALDTDHNDRIDSAEFVSNGVAFFHSSDNGMLFWGSELFGKMCKS